MSRHEERAYRVGTVKRNLASMKAQLTRLRDDLEQFSNRKPNGAMVAPLKERISALEAEIAEAEAGRKRERDARAWEDPGDPRSGGTTRSTQGHFPPRRA